jgi:hypothetical protein
LDWLSLDDLRTDVPVSGPFRSTVALLVSDVFSSGILLLVAFDIFSFLDGRSLSKELMASPTVSDEELFDFDL